MIVEVVTLSRKEVNTGSKRTLAPNKSIFYRKIPIGGIRTQQKEKVPSMAAVDSTCTKKVPFRRMTVDTQYPNPKHVKVPAAVNSTLARTRRPLTHQLRMGGGTGRGWAMRAILLILIPNL